MWASTTTNVEPSATAAAGSNGARRATPRTQQSSGVWTYDGSAFDSAAASAASSTGSVPHKSSELKQAAASSSLWTAGGSASTPSSGVIGSGYVPKSRLLWNRTAPEEEEREEEALPSYLTYLQPSFRSSGGVGGLHDRIAGTGGLGLGGGSTTGSAWSDADSLTRQASTSSLSAASSHFIPSSATFGALSPTAGPFVSATATTSTTVTYGGSTGAVETKTKELALALQEFVRQQVEQQQHRVPTPSRHSAATPPPHSNCQCEPLKQRVSELEQKLMALSRQVSGLMATQSAGAPALTPVPPPPPGVAPLMQPPLPPTPPQSTGIGGAASATPSIGSPSSAAAAASGINDRVSTLEGRQSAFQSQLAQISKVLGVPIGKHGKNSQIKNLVQTLRDEIDAKIVTSSKEIETKCVATMAQDVDRMVCRVVDERLQDMPTGNASPQAQLSYDAVFGALAEEHEASLGKLSAYFEERLAQESKQRVGLESRIQSRFGEHEEWLQQLEGEFGSWHDRSSSVATQLRVLQNKILEMDEKWKAEQLKWSKLASDIQLGVVGGSQTTATSSQTTTTTTTHTSVEMLTRTVHQLQTQYKQFHSEYKTEASELRETLVLMDTWVKTSRQETRDLGKSVKGMKQLVEKLVRDTGSAEELLQQYVSTITHQVASVTRQYVSVRIRDNNRLIDATLRARVPAYVENESESFMLVRPEKKPGQDGEHPASAIASFVLKDDDEEGIRSLLKHQQTEDALLNAASVATSSESSGSSSPAKN